MRKVIMFFAVMFAAVLTVNAQKPFQLGVGINLALPIGDLGDLASFGVGARAQGEIKLAEQVTGLATVSFNRFFYKKEWKDFSGQSGVNAIPIQVGARFYPAQAFFIGAQIGYGLWTGGGDSDGGFNYNPHVGFNTEKFQLILDYNGTSINGANFSWIGIGGVIKL